jgi:hypothetical protein
MSCLRFWCDSVGPEPLERKALSRLDRRRSARRVSGALVARDTVLAHREFILNRESPAGKGTYYRRERSLGG